MRTVVLIAAAACVALGTAVPASAQSRSSSESAESSGDSQFPDLPGMGVAGRASRGEVADYDPGDGSTGGGGSGSTTTGSGGSDGGTTDGEETGDTGDTAPPSAGSIQQLPGTEQIPLIGELTSGTRAPRTTAAGMPRGLTALAALGTLLSVGAFLLARERLLGR